MPVFRRSSGYDYAPCRRGSWTLGLIIAAVSLISYCSTQEFNEVTGEKQYVALSPKEEIALGLNAAPSMAREYGGLSSDAAAQQKLDDIGLRLITQSAAAKTGWQYEFHLLADTQTINAFALPGGQVFMTEGLYRLLTSDAQVAGVLAHEIGHVVARHGAEHVAKQRLSQGLTGATVVATGDYRSGQMAAMVGQLVNMRYGRDDEIESDRLGVRFMAEAGYDPRAMLDVMRILAKASGPRRAPEFFSTHPNPENRIENIQEAIKQQFPGGVPKGLEG